MGHLISAGLSSTKCRRRFVVSLDELLTISRIAVNTLSGDGASSTVDLHRTLIRSWSEPLGLDQG